MRRLPIVGVTVLGLASSVIRAQPETVPTLQQLIDRQLDVPLPVHTCTVPDVVSALARRGYIVAGIESLPGDCLAARQETPRSRETIPLIGLTVADVLAKLVELDGRYRWIDLDGVIVVRPLSAWGDRDHWLHSIASSFDVDQQHIGTALFQIVRGITGEDRPIPTTGMQTELGQRKISLHLRGVSVLEVLNAIVREHGAAWWEARDHARVAERQEDRMLWIYTPDHSGLGVTTKRYPLPQ
jgi:hypothetical protein